MVETVTVSANGFTVTVLVPTAALLTTEVALMVSVPPAVSSSPTVSKPLVLMAVLEDVLPDTAQVTPWGTPSDEPSSSTAAVNWSVLAVFTVVALPAEATVTPSPSTRIVTVASPTAALFTMDVALIVSTFPTVSSSPTVKRPSSLMEVSDAVLPDTVHVTSCDTPSWEPWLLTAALNCSVRPRLTLVAPSAEEITTPSAAATTVTCISPMAVSFS